MPALLLIDTNVLGIGSMRQYRYRDLRHGGREVGAILGIVEKLAELVASHPEHVPIALWDDRCRWREEILPRYKRHRWQTPEQMAFLESYLWQADIARETSELKAVPEAELDELTRIYVGRGLDENLARQVAAQLTQKDALGAHSRDELGISDTVTAHPIQAAVVSAVTFAAGAVVPLIVALLAPAAQITLVVAMTTLIALAVLGSLGASVGGAGVVRGAVRVTFWGALAMAATAGVGMIFGVTAG